MGSASSASVAVGNRIAASAARPSSSRAPKRIGEVKGGRSEGFTRPSLVDKPRPRVERRVTALHRLLLECRKVQHRVTATDKGIERMADDDASPLGSHATHDVAMDVPHDGHDGARLDLVPQLHVKMDNSSARGSHPAGAA